MKKTTLINEIADNSNLPASDVTLVINEAIKTITKSLAEGEGVSFTGFGSFCLVTRKSKNIFLPGSDKKVFIKEKNAIKFRPSKKLKEIVENAEL